MTVTVQLHTQTCEVPSEQVSTAKPQDRSSDSVAGHQHQWPGSPQRFVHKRKKKHTKKSNKQRESKQNESKKNNKTNKKKEKATGGSLWWKFAGHQWHVTCGWPRRICRYVVLGLVVCICFTCPFSLFCFALFLTVS